MDRREFLAGGAAALLGATGGRDGGKAGGDAGGPSSPATAHAPAPPPALPPAFELDEATIADLGAAMASGRQTAVSLAELYLGRIAAIDRAGPTLRAVIEVNPEALEIAAALDAERAATGPRGPLHGIPVLLKDNIDTGDRMRTSAGSLALADAPAPRDAFVAERLRAAGAVLLGKTNLSEWANFRSTRSSSGWSARGGQTRNPYVLDRSPCGSSSGTGAAIAANLAAAGIGTETDGSIVCPSHANGLVGLKPTVGLVSRSGIVPISHSQDTAGPMTRTVTDAALVLTAIVGADPRDPATAARPRRAAAEYTACLDAGALAGARLGVLRQDFGFHAGVDGVMEEALRALRDAGAVLVDPVAIPTAKQVGDDEFTVLLHEFKAGMAAYLATRGTGTPHRTLADLAAFNAANAERELPFFGQELFEQALAKGPLTDPAYRRARARCLRRTRAEGIDLALRRHRLDALVSPTGGPAWVIDLVNGDHFGGGSSTLPAVAGYPSITVPAGFVAGLPIGLTLTAGAWQEGRLLALAYAFEQATRARRAPGFVERIG